MIIGRTPNFGRLIINVINVKYSFIHLFIYSFIHLCRERRVNVTDGDLEAVISHLRPGINYNFKVVAFNDQGRRGESSEVIVKTKDEGT